MKKLILNEKQYNRLQNIIIDKDEAKVMKWFTVEEIKNIQLEEVWEYWFKKLKII